MRSEQDLAWKLGVISNFLWFWVEYHEGKRDKIPVREFNTVYTKMYKRIMREST